MAGSARSILEQLVQIPSATGNEQAVAHAFAGLCEKAGLDVEMQEVEPGRKNVVARWSVGRGPRMLLTGHLDTVPVGEGWSRDPFGAEVDGGRLYGRGACDMKGGLAAMLGAVVASAGVPRRISAWRAASDAGFLVHAAGIPCVLFGPGDIEQGAHRPDEWIDLEDLAVAQRVFERLLLGPEPGVEVVDGSVPR